MHRYRQILKTLIALIFYSVVSEAGAADAYRAREKTPDYCFRHFTTSNSRLSFNGINCLAEDNIGFIWIGTSDGLNRYDGSQFTTFMKDELGLSSSFIVSLFYDNDRLWIGTDNGVAYYDYNLNRFIPFLTSSNKGTVIRGKITVITKDNNGNIWFAANEHGAFRYDKSSGHLYNYFIDSDHRLAANIRSIYFDDNNRCLLSLYFKNLYVADLVKERLTPVSVNNDPSWFANDNIINIQKASDSSIYVLSVNRGLTEIVHNGTGRTLTAEPVRYEPMGMKISPAGDIWIATSGGLFHYAREYDRLRVINHEPANSTSLTDNYLTCFMQDSRGGLWCGTFSSGLDYSSSLTDNFNRVFIKSGHTGQPAKVKSISIDIYGNIWLATDGAGLMRTDGTSGVTVRYRPDIIPEHTYDVCVVNKELWISASDGIYRIDTESGSCHHYDSDNSKAALWENKLIGIRSTSGSDVLILTTLGLYRYNRAHNSFDAFKGLDECYITDIAEDDYGDLWISTFAHGLIHYDTARQRIISAYHHNDADSMSLPTDKLLSVMIDNHGNVWASSFGAGILNINEMTGVKVYDRKYFGDILPSNVIYQILQDRSGKMWATTSCGLLSFERGKCNATIYHTHHGLLNEDFATARGTVGRDGTFYLCSADGYVSFKPQLLRATTDNHRLVITGFRINGERIEAGDRSSILERSIDITNTIRLNHKQNDIEFTLSDISFSDIGGMNGLFYRLNGSEREWRPIPADGVLSFPNMTPGDYTLEFCRILSDSVSSTSIKPLHAPVSIHMSEVFYKTTFAQAAYILISLILISIIWQVIYQRRMKRAETIRQHQLKEQEMKAYNEKIDMISYIANSLRTPLALIRNPLTNILRTGVDGQLADDFMVIRNGTERLSKVLAEFTALNDPHENQSNMESENSEEESVPVMILPGGGNIIKLTDADAEFIKKLDEIVMENIGDPDLSNTILAHQLCMSKSTLVRKIKNLLNTTPKDYVLARRLALAAEMLKNPSCRVNEVCYAVGFNTPSYFTKCFKKAYGMLPSEYRLENDDNTTMKDS